jgi:hypothetical protein
LVRRRTRCSDKARSGCRDATLYENLSYPHRWFHLAVVVAAVAIVAFGSETLAVAAARCSCHRRTVGRWLGWVARLCDLASIGRLSARIDPEAMPPPAWPQGVAGVAAAGACVVLLDHLARLLRHRGVDLARDGPGLAALLCHQHARFGVVAYLTRFSPPMRADSGGFLGYEPPS